jgi:hypothetical protein
VVGETAVSIFKALGYSLKVLEYSAKYLPSWVVGVRYWSYNRERLRRVTYERVPYGVVQPLRKYENSLTGSFLNHVVRSSSKTTRHGNRSGHKAKLSHPVLPEERRFSNFHQSCDHREDYTGFFFTKEGEQKKGSLEDPLVKLALQANVGIKSNIYYLKGSIGSGKSTLFSTILVRLVQEQQKEKIQRPSGMLPIDFCIVSFEDLDVKDRFKTDDELLAAMKLRIQEELSTQVDVKGESLEELLRLASSSYRFSLFIDGLDYLYAEFCRISLLNLSSSLSIYYSAIVKILGELTNGKLSELRLNVFIALRVETLEMLKNRVELLNGTSRISIPEECVFALEKPPAEKLIDVFSKRVGLALSEDQTLPELKVAAAYPFPEFYRIAVHGLRHMMDTWRKTFAYIPVKKVGERIYAEARLFRLFFLASGTGLYSQVNHGLTNIFLVNPSFRVEVGDISPDEAISIDRPTYWLKYFMLVYVTKSSVDPTAVLKLFSHKGRYSEKLIRLILLGFSEVGHGRVVKPMERGHLGDKTLTVGLESTSRGKALVETKVLFSFEYLCCVVEDYYLRVPSSVVDFFANPRSLAFLCEEDDEVYKEGLFLYLKEKAATALTFISILEESYKIEKRRDPDLFAVFEDHRYQDYVPDFNKMRMNAIQALDELSAPLDNGKRSDILEEIKRAVKISRIDLIRRSLKEIFHEPRLR